MHAFARMRIAILGVTGTFARLNGDLARKGGALQGAIFALVSLPCATVGDAIAIESLRSALG
jgi:hypothetical protein